jgi:hypothetical protein
MTSIDPSLELGRDSCEVDRSCADSSCGCAPAASSTSGPSRRGLRAGLFAVACALGCLAVPLALGGVAAAAGAMAGGGWVAIGLAGAMLALGATVVLRRRSGRVC